MTAALADRYSVTVVPLGKRQTIATLVALSPDESNEEAPVGLVKKLKTTEEAASGEITSNHQFWNVVSFIGITFGASNFLLESHCTFDVVLLIVLLKVSRVRGKS